MKFVSEFRDWRISHGLRNSLLGTLWTSTGWSWARYATLRWERSSRRTSQIENMGPDSMFTPIADLRVHQRVMRYDGLLGTVIDCDMDSIVDIAWDDGRSHNIQGRYLAAEMVA